jgi:hypothetical protein
MRCPAESGQSHASGIWTAKLGVVMTLAALSLGGCADLPVFHGPAQFAGFATTPKEGQDFVRESHPEKTEFTSVGVEPAKPPAKPRDAKGVKELQAELEAQRDTGHAIIQKLSPGTAAATPQTPEEKIKAKQKQKEEAARKAKDKQAGDAAQPASQ